MDFKLWDLKLHTQYDAFQTIFVAFISYVFFIIKDN